MWFPTVLTVLDQFQDVFEPPVELPPRRACDHRIALVPGATPVSSRPYRYAPALKDEMEKQVVEMSAGIIQPRASPFSSPMLLVKKKDGSWRFLITRVFTILQSRASFLYQSLMSLWMSWLFQLVF
jgi:hypothetical protein